MIGSAQECSGVLGSAWECLGVGSAREYLGVFESIWECLGGRTDCEERLDFLLAATDKKLHLLILEWVVDTRAF